MSTSLKHFILQGSIFVSWIFLVILPLTNESVEAQITCPKLKYIAPIPGWSWYANTTVTVKIDDSWNESERAAIADGNMKWNDFNCSGVEFVDFSEKAYRCLNIPANRLMALCIGNALTRKTPGSAEECFINLMLSSE
jgi:hypothetical protein